ncbi:MAG TPA: hydantoinase B/oxoprolinase family protein, partial [Acetobacteraceae bacterium]|nr:hydantoinase B/oxoprolinase family protein [Acetobacteraceae bacterium]
REAGDLSAGIFDLSGRMLAQAVTGTPGHVNSMMESVGHFLDKFPAYGIRSVPWSERQSILQVLVA